MNIRPRNLTMPPIDAPNLIESLDSLPKYGDIKSTDSGFVYVDIEDAFIHQSFPLLQIEGIQKPDMSAHISLAYPEENATSDDSAINFISDFTITDIFSAVLGSKIYYALKVESPEIKRFRKRLGLPELLTFKGHSIFSHITIATKT